MVTKYSEKSFLRDADDDGIDASVALATYEKYKTALAGLALPQHHEDFARHAASGTFFGGTEDALNRFVNELDRAAPVTRAERDALVAAIKRVK